MNRGGHRSQKQIKRDKKKPGASRHPARKQGCKAEEPVVLARANARHDSCSISQRHFIYGAPYRKQGCARPYRFCRGRGSGAACKADGPAAMERNGGRVARHSLASSGRRFRTPSFTQASSGETLPGRGPINSAPFPTALRAQGRMLPPFACGPASGGQMHARASFCFAFGSVRAHDLRLSSTKTYKGRQWPLSVRPSPSALEAVDASPERHDPSTGRRC